MLQSGGYFRLHLTNIKTMAAEIFEKLSNIFSSSVTVKAEEEDEEEEEEEEVMKKRKFFKINIFLMEVFFD